MTKWEKQVIVLPGDHNFRILSGHIIKLFFLRSFHSENGEVCVSWYQKSSYRWAEFVGQTKFHLCQYGMVDLYKWHFKIYHCAILSQYMLCSIPHTSCSVTYTIINTFTFTNIKLKSKEFTSGMTCVCTCMHTCEGRGFTLQNWNRHTICTSNHYQLYHSILHIYNYHFV